MENPSERGDLDWSGQLNSPHPDFLSSSRKRLVPQLLYKGGILNSWGKKIAVALDYELFRTLPSLDEVAVTESDLAWLIYRLEPDASKHHRYVLQLQRTFATQFQHALNTISHPSESSLEQFLNRLQGKLDKGGYEPSVLNPSWGSLE